MCPNWGDHEDRRETQGLGTIICFGMNGFIATNIFFIWHREVSLNPSGRSTNQMMLPNRILSYQAKLQNYHEFIHSNLLSDSGFSIISIVEFQRNQKQKIGVVLIVKAANGEKIIRPNFCAYICSLNQAYCPPAISGY